MLRTMCLLAGAVVVNGAWAQPCTSGFQTDTGFIGAGEFSPIGQAPRVLAGTRWDPDGSGPLAPVFVVAGSFAGMDGTAANSIAAWDGEVWSALPGLFTNSNSGVTALAVHNGELYAAGRFGFTSIEGHLDRVARWNGTAWQLVGTGPLSGPITSLLSFSGDIFVGGSFAAAPGRDIARLVGGVWQGFQIIQNGPGTNNSRVDTLAVFNDQILAGGTFPGRVARLTTPPGGFVPFGGTIGCQFSCSGGVLGLAVDGADLYAVGDYRLQNNSQPGVMRWDGAAWVAMPVTPSSLTAYRSIARVNGDLLLALPGNSQQTGILRWNGTQWVAFGPFQWWNAATGVPLRILGELDGRWLFGGGFSDITDAPAAPSRPVRALAVYDGVRFIAPSRGVSARVVSMMPYDGETLAVGRFKIAAMRPVDYIAIRGAAGEWREFAPGAGFNADAWAMTMHQGSLVVAGSFTQAGGVPVNRVARWTGSAWEAMGDGLPAFPAALASAGGSLLAGVSSLAGRTDQYSGLFRWDGAAWVAVAFPAGASRLTVLGGEVYCGGSDGTPRVFRWDGSAFVALPLPADQSRLFILGRRAGELQATNAGVIYRWTGTQWLRAGLLPRFGIDPYGPDTASDERVMYLGTNRAFNAEEVLSWDGYSWGSQGSMPLNPSYGTGTQSSSLRPPTVLLDGGPLLVGGAFQYTDAQRTRAGAYFARQLTDWRPLTTSAPPPYVEAEQGATLDLAWTLTGTVNFYSWFKDGVQLADGPVAGVGVVSGATTAALRVAGLGPESSGDYWCVARNACGTVTLSATRVRVPSLCDPDLTGDGNADQDDVAYLTNVLAGGDNPLGRDPDFNLDGNTDQEDLAALITVIAGGECP